MTSSIRKLEPVSLWNHFSNLNAVPRPSKKEERVIEFMVDFGKKLQLQTLVDGVGNVIITKPATKGFENKKTIVMQSHLDMVHQKNSETVFNFETEGIRMYIDGDWVTADGTTLGADNGLGVATIMAILSSDDIKHPAIEALFTIDEETGMTGAMGLEGGILTGEILLNLDTEEDDEIDMGCAGGIDVTATRRYTEEATPENTTAFKIAIKGLQGGHSGMDIHKGFGNANKIMNRLLYHGFEHANLQIAELEGGSLRNAIPRESFSTILIDKTLKETFLSEMNLLIDSIKDEFNTIEPNLTRYAVHIFFRYTHSNSQMCISVIETKRCPIHGLVSLRSGYAEIPPGLPAKHIPPNPLDGGRPRFARYLSQAAPTELGD